MQVGRTWDRISYFQGVSIDESKRQHMQVERKTNKIRNQEVLPSGWYGGGKNCK